MDKIKIGIPRSMYYYYYKDLWINLLKQLGFEIIISPKTNKQIMNLGNQYAYDEMCLSLKNYIGHVAYLQGKCDYILVPRIDNFGPDNQTCTNFLATFDIIHNLFEENILNYNIDHSHHETELKGFIHLLKPFGISKKEIMTTYLEVKEKIKVQQKNEVRNNLKKLNSLSTKILIVGHPYNVYDDYIGKPIIKILKQLQTEIIYSNLFNPKIAQEESKKISKTLYWKYSKEIIGCIPRIIGKIDGIIFLSTFPCGLDSLVNELVIRKLKLPTLNLIIDDMDSLTGFETRLESFVDVVRERKKQKNEEKN